jgi:SPX domain protein involved in polyphosphate accumulation
VYRRTAFQLGNNQSHRISIDSNLHIIEEPAGQVNWYRDYQELLQLPEVMLFPYAILGK